MVQSNGYLEELKSDFVLKDMKYHVIIDSIGGKNISVSQSLLDSLGKVVVIGEDYRNLVNYKFRESDFTVLFF